MIRYLIVDDEYMAHNIIKGYCDMLPNMELQHNCYDALEALDYLANHQVDLIFLDLNMPRLKGFDFLRTLHQPPRVIVTTAYSEHALEGFELNVADYLLKPFGFPRFLKAVNKAVSAHRPAGLASLPAQAQKPDSIFLRENKKYIQVVVGTIRYFEAAGNYTKVNTQNGTITTREKISDLLAMLPDSNFLQVHKSFAVAIAFIQSIEGNRIKVGEAEIPIGKQFKGGVDRLVR